jgi:ribosomal protein S18 acetylase RimI-like enzyme
MEPFRKTIQLKDGGSIVIRPLSKQDGAALLKFFASVPEEDRLFLKEDVTQKEVIDRWINDLDFDKVYPLIAEKESTILGDATLHFNKYRWQVHMAEIRCVVAREYQRKSIGTALMRELITIAEQKGVSKIRANMMDIQKSAQRTFQRLDFKKEAELKDFLIDSEGKTHNLILMVNDVSDLWRKMEDLLILHDVKHMY